MFADESTAEAIAWLDHVAVSPSEEQRIFSSAIEKLNQRHRGAIDAFPALPRAHIQLAAAWWFGPSLALYVLGRSIGWVVAGFRKRPV